MIQALGVVAGLCALALLVLPAVRVGQGAIPVRMALGLWIAGVGFGLLAVAALALDGPAANAAVMPGVALAVLGNFIQRWQTR
jgi:hypothetical protein